MESVYDDFVNNVEELKRELERGDRTVEHTEYFYSADLCMSDGEETDAKSLHPLKTGGRIGIVVDSYGDAGKRRAPKKVTVEGNISMAVMSYTEIRKDGSEVDSLISLYLGRGQRHGYEILEGSASPYTIKTLKSLGFERRATEQGK